MNPHRTIRNVAREEVPMPKLGIVSVAIKLMGIVFIATALPRFPITETMYMLKHDLAPGRTVSAAFVFRLFCVWFGPLLALGFGVKFIRSSDKLSSRLLRRLENRVLLVSAGVEREDVLMVLLLVIGAWFVVQGIGNIVRAIAGDVLYAVSWEDINLHAIAVGGFYQFLIGLLIYCQPRRIARWIERFQH